MAKVRQKTSPTAILSNEQAVYCLITPTEALAEISRTTKEVNEVLNLPSTTLVRLILSYFRWDKNTLTERFYDDPDKLFQTLNVANPNLSPSLQWNPLSPAVTVSREPLLPTNNNSIITCRICCSDVPSNEIYSLRCRHQHCLSCWQSYLESNIAITGCTQSISCPSRCIQVIDDEQILHLLQKNENLRDRYQRFLVDAFVESNRLTHWCPGNSCSTIVKMRSYSPKCAQMVECDNCTTIFCFQCLKQWHAPIQCSLLQKWEQKNLDESMSGTWIIANTKECPSCHANIEKNGGCNHMTCQRSGCGHEFCWICLGVWLGHASYHCNVYRQKDVEKSQSENLEILQCYMHYYTRYQTHNQSLELEGKLLGHVVNRMEEMKASSMSFTEQQSPQRAFDVLQQCRRTLKYTYPFAFYLQRNNQSEIFEQNQADLERATEILSGFLEKEINVEDNIALKLMNQAHYCDQRRKILLDHCKEGFSKNYWKGLDPI